MSRLTSHQVIKHADGTEHIETYCHGHRYGIAAFPMKYGTSSPQEYQNYCEMVDKLAEYEDAEEQGLLIKLPCKVGDIVYRLLKGSCLKLTSSVIAGLNCDNSGWKFETTHGLILPLSSFGKTVFLTRAEAKKAIKEGATDEK